MKAREPKFGIVSFRDQEWSREKRWLVESDRDGHVAIVFWVRAAFLGIGMPLAEMIAGVIPAQQQRLAKSRISNEASQL